MDHRIVEPVVAVAAARSVHRADVEGHSRIQHVVPGHDASQRRAQLLQGHRSQEAEPAEVHAEHRNAGWSRPSRAAQQRAVAS